MSKESKLQSTIRSYLKKQGCYVIVTKPQPGIPDGCPDILFMKEGFWGGIEVKDSRTAKFQPLQKETVEKFDNWSWARVVYPENWATVRSELEGIL